MKNFSHPEMGHMLIKKHEEDLNFSGICPFHNDCLEGLTSGPSIEKRLNIKGEYISRDRKSTRLNSSHVSISYAVFCLKKKNPTSMFHACLTLTVSTCRIG